MSQQSDLISVTMTLCRDLCDMAHVLSRMTTMPAPNDETHKEAIKGCISSLYGRVMIARAELCALGDIANFDTAEIIPGGGNIPQEIRDKIDKITGFIRGENDLDPETTKSLADVVDLTIDKTDIPEKKKEQAKSKIGDLINQLNVRRKENKEKEESDEATDDGDEEEE